jgi:hypothetical protein
MQYTLHITADATRLIKAWDMAAAEKALGVPTFEFQAKNGETVTAFKSRRAALQFCAARKIGEIAEITFKRVAVA